MTNHLVQLSSYENAEYSFDRRRRQAQSYAQQSAEAFMNSRSSKNFISHFSHKVINASHIFTGVLFALFVVVLLIAIVIGTNIYKSLYQANGQISEERMATSLLFNTIKTADAQNALEIGRGPEGRALVLNECTSSGTYETRLYLYEGSLVQEYAYDGASYDPRRASPLIETERFDFDYRDGLLTITTDQGQINITFRCAMEEDTQ